MKKEFHLTLQLTKTIIFNVSYYTLGNNTTPYFTTSADKFAKNKLDYVECGQAQDRLLFGYAKRFWQKWDKYHLQDLTEEQYDNLTQDIATLKDIYNYLYVERETPEQYFNGFSFNELAKFSKQNVKK